jgi:MFS superfamily sulfate permease-like transporter/CRP-like cAMP-binding protein
MKEQRKAERIEAPALSAIIGERKTTGGIIHDLNTLGARMVTEVSLRKGETAKITVDLPEKRGSFRAEAQVIWHEPSEDPRYPHHVGMKFKNIDKNELAKLEAYIAAHDEVPEETSTPKHSWTSNLGGDAAGGTTATILALPEAMAYGTIVFAPLGPEYVSVGVVAGLIALCFSNLGAAGCGGVRIMNNGPYSLTSLMLASAMTIIAGKVSDGNPAIVIGLLMMIVFMSGLFQVVFGILKVGEMVKYIPYPVTSGLLNGTAILIFLGQIRPMLGLARDNLLTDFNSMQPLTLVVGLVTIAVIFLGPKLTKKIPPPFLGIAAGTLVYYILELSGFKGGLGAKIGAIPFAIPIPRYAIDFSRLFFSEHFLMIVKELSPLALSIAVVASLQSLIASVSADNILRERSNTNRELIGQGIGNITSSVFGGILCAGSQSRAMANYSYGGRTASSRIAAGVFALAVLLFISPLVAKLPKVVLAGTLVVLALRGFDAWSLNLLNSLFSRQTKKKQVLSDLSVVVAVAAILAVIGVFEAVGAGIFISVLFFVLRMGKDVIRRQYDATRIRSNVQRPYEEIAYLEKYGDRIRVFELEGALFFGTADRLAMAIDEVIETRVEYVVVDLLHVSDIDSTGANILSRIGDRCRDKGKHLLLSSITLTKGRDALMTELSILDVDDDESYFYTIDDALGWAEDRLLDEYFGKDRYDEVIPLSKIDVLEEFSEAERNVLMQYLGKAEHEPEKIIFRQGGPGDRVFFLVQGKVQIVVDLPEGQAKQKIATLCPGTVFGEMSIIDHGPRSASVIAETHATCFHLRYSESLRLNKEQPELDRKLMIGFARELSKRVRIANRISTELRA